jgi:hypothetical protein
MCNKTNQEIMMEKHDIKREVKIERMSYCYCSCRMLNQIEWRALRFVLVVITFIFLC